MSGVILFTVHVHFFGIKDERDLTNCKNIIFFDNQAELRYKNVLPILSFTCPRQRQQQGCATVCGHHNTVSHTLFQRHPQALSHTYSTHTPVNGISVLFGMLIRCWLSHFVFGYMKSEVQHILIYRIK